MNTTLRRFLTDDHGAATVDWVLLGTGLVGMSMALTAGVLQGLGDIGDDVAQILAERDFSLAAFLHSDDFESGPGNWIGAVVADIAGFGNILGPVAGTATGVETVFQTFAMPAGAASAVLSFDLLSLDSLDGGNTQWGVAEGPVLYINGVEVARAASNQGRLTWTFHDVPGVSVESTEIRAGENVGGVTPGRQEWHDGINRVTITVADPGESLRFGFGLKANQPITDESAGLDNFSISTSAAGV